MSKYLTQDSDETRKCLFSRKRENDTLGPSLETRIEVKELQMKSTQSRMNGTDDKILTRHPLGKSGRNISKVKYDLLKKEIVSLLRRAELTHDELMTQLKMNLRGNFDGNIGWYGETVKLDLEARKTVVRTSSTPQKYRVRIR